RVLVNASAYRMRWNDVQMPLYDIVNLISANVNGPSYIVQGVELQAIARITDGLSVQGSGSWNSSSQAPTPCIRSAGVTPAPRNNPTRVGQCITVVDGHPYTSPFNTPNTPLPFSPPVLFNVRARYDWTVGVDKLYAWAGASHIAAMHNEPASFPDGSDPAQN